MQQRLLEDELLYLVSAKGAYDIRPVTEAKAHRQATTIIPTRR